MQNRKKEIELPAHKALQNERHVKQEQAFATQPTAIKVGEIKNNKRIHTSDKSCQSR